MNRLDVDFLVKTIFTNVVSFNPPIAKSTPDRIVKCVVISVVSIGLNLNVAANARQYLRNLGIGLIVHAVDFDTWPLLSLLVSDLTHISINLVNGQTRTCFKITAILNLHGPLIACGKL